MSRGQQTLSSRGRGRAPGDLANAIEFSASAKAVNAIDASYFAATLRPTKFHEGAVRTFMGPTNPVIPRQAKRAEGPRQCNRVFRISESRQCNRRHLISRQR